MRSVRSAARPSVIHTSGLCCGVSYSHARSYPNSSASATCAGDSSVVGKAHEISIRTTPFCSSGAALLAAPSGAVPRTRARETQTSKRTDLCRNAREPGAPRVRARLTLGDPGSCRPRCSPDGPRPRALTHAGLRVGVTARTAASRRVLVLSRSGVLGRCISHLLEQLRIAATAVRMISRSVSVTRHSSPKSWTYAMRCPPSQLEPIDADLGALRRRASGERPQWVGLCRVKWMRVLAAVAGPEAALEPERVEMLIV